MMAVQIVQLTFVSILRCEMGGGIIQVFHQKNKGVTSARHKGVSLASSSWIMFVDADDVLPPYALSDFYRETLSGKYDIIIGRIDDLRYDSDEISAEHNKYYSITGQYLPNTLWCRLIAADLLISEPDPLDIPREIIKGEDMLANIKIAFKNIKPVRLLSKKLYLYNVDSNGVINTFKNNVAYEILFNKYLKASIPFNEQKSYKFAMITSQVQALIACGFSERKNTWRELDYYKDMMQEIKVMNYPLPLLTRLFLNSKHTNKLITIHSLLKALYRKII